MSENSVYIITPPDMQLLSEGPSVTALSSDPIFIQQVETIHENIFKTVSINLYHPDGDVNDSNLAWVLSVMRLSDNVFVDLNTVNQAALVAALISDANIIFIANENNDSAVLKLLNTSEQYTIYRNPGEYLEMVVANLAK
jgi:hypothetical protein